MHCAGGARPLRSLATFAHRCAADGLTRCMATATLVTTLWQVAGRAMPFQPPSFLLVNAGDLVEDPLDRLAGASTGQGQTTTNETEEQSSRNRGLMIGLINERNKISRENPLALETHVRRCLHHFREARGKAFGSGRAGSYAARMDGQLGCVTDWSDDTILRLDRPADHERFRDDLRNHPERLRKLAGYNDAMERVPKRAYVAGSLAPAQWDGALLADIVGPGLPVLFLPHAAQQALKLREPVDFNMIAYFLAAGALQRETAALPDLPERLASCEASLRSRLRHFPAAYEFFILRTIRELGGVCARLAAFVAQDKSPPDERAALHRDLHTLCVRAVTLGVEALVWHGRGFDAGCPREVAVQVLEHIRGKSEMSRRDVQRKFAFFTAEGRDGVLECLAAEGLLELDGNKVMAVPLADFIRSLPSRPWFKEPGLLCPALLAKWELMPAP